MAISLDEFNEKGVEAKGIGVKGEGKSQKLIDFLTDNVGQAVSIDECCEIIGVDTTDKKVVGNVANLLFGIRKRASKGLLGINVDMKKVGTLKYYAAIQK